MTINIFISHISVENSIAESLADCISTDFLGMIEVFVSSNLESIVAGSNWFKSISDALDRADMLLVLCSPQSIGRPWINFEAGAAWTKKIPLIPICHSGLKVNELPMPFSELQAVSVTESRDLQRLYNSIASTLKSKPPSRSFDDLASKLSSRQEILPLGAHGRSIISNSDAPEIELDKVLLKAIDGAALGWTLCFIGEDQTDKIVELTNDLNLHPSDIGYGKKFASGFSYWGIGPTMAWARACTDPMYIVMQKGIRTFPERWRVCSDALKSSMHYVSLGVGTGTKDRKIVRDLLDKDKSTRFFPIDMSGEMLRHGIAECSKNEDMRRSYILPIQIDFSKEENAQAIKNVVTSVIGSCPVLYSLLGNTLANFDDDEDLLTIISEMLRPQDQLLLEVAITNEISAAAAIQAADEYRRSESFYLFAISALNSYTSINVENCCISYLSDAVNDACLEVRVVYRNELDSAMSFKVPTGKQVTINPKETIRLFLTRKYEKEKIKSMFDRCGCKIDAHSCSQRTGEGFGLALFLLSRK